MLLVSVRTFYTKTLLLSLEPRNHGNSSNSKCNFFLATPTTTCWKIWSWLWQTTSRGPWRPTLLPLGRRWARPTSWRRPTPCPRSRPWRKGWRTSSSTSGFSRASAQRRSRKERVLTLFSWQVMWLLNYEAKTRINKELVQLLRGNLYMSHGEPSPLNDCAGPCAFQSWRSQILNRARVFFCGYML